MVQAAVENTQRGWKRQPEGRSNGAGTVPSIASRRSRVSSIFGMLPSSPSVYGMLRVVEDVGAGSAFHHAAGVHHRDLVGHFGDDAKIVRDQDDCHTGLLLQVRAAGRGSAPAPSHRARWWVRRRSAGPVRRRAPWRSSRVAACRRTSGADIRRSGVRARGCARVAAPRWRGCAARRRGSAVVRAHRLGDLVADGEHRVQAGHRLLEDHRDAVAADVAHPREREIEQVLPVEYDLAGGDAPRRGTRRITDSDSTDLPQPLSPTMPRVGREPRKGPRRRPRQLRRRAVRKTVRSPEMESSGKVMRPRKRGGSWLRDPLMRYGTSAARSAPPCGGPSRAWARCP